MHMVRHQAPGMHSALETPGELLQVEEIAGEILFGEKASGPIVAALDNMDGDIGQHKARVARHDSLNADQVRRVDAPENVVCP